MDDLGAFILNQLAHTAGHFDRAADNGADITLHGRDLAETWRYNPIEYQKQTRTLPTKKGPRQLTITVPRYEKDPKIVDSEIASGGFGMQGEIGSALQDPTYDNAEAIYKLLYLTGIQNHLGNGISGDVRQIERASGNRNVDVMLALSALDDLRRSNDPKSNWRFDYTSADGTPVGKFSFRMKDIPGEKLLDRIAP